MIYSISESIGRFADEAEFKKAYCKHVKLEMPEIAEILYIENEEEPGMPDLMLIDKTRKIILVETKYAEGNVISFKKTQIPWYIRHQNNIPIMIAAYHPKTGFIHSMSADYAIAKIQKCKLKLEDYSQLVLWPSVRRSFIRRY